MRPSSRCTPGLTLLTVACVLSLAPCPRSSLAADSFVNFESEPVRPLALAPSPIRPAVIASGGHPAELTGGPGLTRAYTRTATTTPGARR